MKNANNNSKHGATSSSRKVEQPASNWKLKGDGVAFTTSEDLFKSSAGRAMLASAAKIDVKKN
jgi:hypothetical protein